jgi:hypothetical protein
MTTKAEFNAEEWSKVLAGPPAAGLRVVLADRGGTIRESMQMGRVYAEARNEQGSSELLDEIVAEQPGIDPADFGSPEEAPGAAMRQLQEAITVLNEKARPEEVEDFKAFVRELAERVASAHKEGGVLGIGGKEVSESERAALDEIEAALA